MTVDRVSSIRRAASHRPVSLLIKDTVVRLICNMSLKAHLQPLNRGRQAQLEQQLTSPYPPLAPTSFMKFRKRSEAAEAGPPKELNGARGDRRPPWRSFRSLSATSRHSGRRCVALVLQNNNETSMEVAQRREPYGSRATSIPYGSWPRFVQGTPSRSRPGAASPLHRFGGWLSLIDPEERERL
jgi:hypothetical protein